MNRISTIVGLVFLVVAFAVAVDAEADCLTCHTYTGMSGPGYCAWYPGSFCSRTCCGASWGDPCTIPDFFDPCYGARSAVFQVSLFENRMPRPQIVPNCRFKAEVRKQQEIPRRAVG